MDTSNDDRTAMKRRRVNLLKGRCVNWLHFAIQV